MDKSWELQTSEICGLLGEALERFKCEGGVVHLDGGLGSAVTAALARRALGKNVLGLIMPTHTPARDVEDGVLVAEHLGLDYERVNLGPIHDQLLGVLPEAVPEADSRIESRLRMIVLHHYAAGRNYLVLGAATRSDWEIGLITEHGEQAAHVLPLIRLMKSQLQGLARHLALPAQIIGKSLPTLTCSALGQTAVPPCTYLELDAFLSGDLMQVREDSRKRIQAMIQDADQKRRLLAGPFFPSSWVDKEPHVPDDHLAYDKSIEALTLISKAITSDQYLEDILRLIVMVTAEVMNSSVCSLWLLDEKEGVLRLRATQSIDQEYLKDRVLRVGEGVVGKVVAENRPYVVRNVLTDPFFKEKELARRMGLVSTLSMPMRVKDRVIGVINCHTSHPHVFSDLQMNVLTAVANQAAVAIEKTELMVQTKVIQEELEKRKIIERAKDLLMKRFALSGEESYRWLQKRSMNTRKSMREVSEAVLLAMEDR
jgi:NAD+ synthetase